MSLRTALFNKQLALSAVLASLMASVQADDRMPFSPVENGDGNNGSPLQPPMMPGSDAQPPPVQAKVNDASDANPGMGQQPNAQTPGQAQPQAIGSEPKNNRADGSRFLNAGAKRNGFGQPMPRGTTSRTYAEDYDDADIADVL